MPIFFDTICSCVKWKSPDTPAHFLSQVTHFSSIFMGFKSNVIIKFGAKEKGWGKH